MKTTIELPDDLLREAKSTAARQGSSLKQVLTIALREHLERSRAVLPGAEAWRSVFGRAKRSQIAAVDAAIAEDLERVDLESWR